MAIGFDKLTTEFNPTFSEIPGLIEATRVRDARRESLANINVKDSASLIAAGQRLLRAGDFAGGTKLIEEGRGLKTAEAAALSGEVYKGWAADQAAKKAAGGAAEPPRDIFGFRRAPGTPPSEPGETPWPAPGGGNLLPPGTGTGAAAPRAEAGPGGAYAMAPPEEEEVKPYRVAGPAVAPPLAAAAPVTEQAQYLPSYATPEGRAPVAGARPPGTSVAPPRRPNALPTQEGALDAAEEAIAELRAIPGLALTNPAKEAKLLQVKRLLAQAKLAPEHHNWANANLERMAEGLEPLTYDGYTHRKEIGKVEYESTLKRYDKYQEKREKAEQLSTTIDQLAHLVKHKNFESGEGTQLVDYGKRVLGSVRDLARSNGIDISPELNRRIDTITASVHIRDAFDSLVGQGIFDKLGSLGAQTSDRDLTFTQRMFPSLRTSVEGNKMMIEYYQEAIRKNRELGKRVQEVYDKFEKKGMPMSPLDIDRVATQFWNENNVLVDKDGNKSKLAERMENHAARLGGGASPPPGEETPAGALRAIGEDVTRGVNKYLGVEATSGAAGVPKEPGAAGTAGGVSRPIATNSKGERRFVNPDGSLGEVVR